MNPRPLVAFVFMSAVLLFGVCDVAGQAVAEARIADTRYRFVDVRYTRTNGVVLGGFYVGVPGNDEINAGAGYAFKRNALTLTPMLYAVIGREGEDGGLKVALLATYERTGWKFVSFLGAFVPTSGTTASYLVLDTADLTRTIGKWELGLQAGFFRSGESWDMQLDPLLKFNDAHGAWAVSSRLGEERVIRVGRVFVF